jgi:hypothetical protein
MGYDPLPILSADEFGLGSPKGDPGATQASRRGNAWGDFDKRFICNRNRKMPGGQDENEEAGKAGQRFTI